MGFWEKSVRIFKCFCDHGRQGVRCIAQQTGLSKSSVHRLTQAMERRDLHPESWLWETAEGRQWLTRLVVATLYTFGLKRGVGVDTMSAFFARLHLETQVGCSPCALRQVLQALAETAGEIAKTWEQDASAAGERREIIGGVDETFLERMIVVLQDLPTGYLVLEAIANDRTFTTWKALVDERLKALGAEVWDLVSARATALIQLAEKGLECRSMPDFFHVTHEIVKSYSLAIGQRLRQAHKELKQAQEALARLPGRPQAEPADSAAKVLVEARQAEVTHWAEVQHTYWQHLETLSLPLHPFHIADSAPQTSAQVASQLQATVEAIEALAQRHQLPTRREAMTKVRKPVPALAALVDFWWQGVQQDLEPFILSPRWRSWVHECLLPLVYWEHQAAHTRCARRKAKMRQALEAVQATFQAHAITKQLLFPVLAEWKAWATQRTKAFQRTSSAVEGRNGYLSQLHHNQRGLPKQRYKVWTVLHNFDCHAADGTTPAARFFGRAFPDLFETVLSRLDTLPQPRRRKHHVALSP